MSATADVNDRRARWRQRLGVLPLAAPAVVLCSSCACGQAESSLDDAVHALMMVERDSREVAVCTALRGIEPQDLARLARGDDPFLAAAARALACRQRGGVEGEAIRAVTHRPTPGLRQAPLGPAGRAGAVDAPGEGG